MGGRRCLSHLHEDARRPMGAVGRLAPRPAARGDTARGRAGPGRPHLTGPAGTRPQPPPGSGPGSGRSRPRREDVGGGAEEAVPQSQPGKGCGGGHGLVPLSLRSCPPQEGAASARPGLVPPGAGTCQLGLLRERLRGLAAVRHRRSPKS